VEEQFYLVWPLVVFFLSGKWVRNVLFAMLIIPLVLRLIAGALGWGWHFQADFPLCRFDSIAAGALIACWVRSPNCSWRRLKLVGFCAVLAGLFGATLSVASGEAPQQNPTFIYSFLALLFGGCLILSLSYDWAALRLGVLRYIGKISYGIYVFHLPIFVFTTAALQRRASPVALIAFEFALSFGIASLSWRFFESPILRLKNRF
jgi:peptidoglycan/LPS O-acetylase OafA/YrhL